MTKSLSINFFNTRSKRAFGLLGFALSLGATGALVTQNSSQNIARNTSSNATMRNSMLKRDNQRVRTTYISDDDYCTWYKQNGFTYSSYINYFCRDKGRSVKKNAEIEELKRKVENLDTRLKTVEKDLGEIKTNTAQTNVLLRELIDKIGKST